MIYRLSLCVAGILALATVAPADETSSTVSTTSSATTTTVASSAPATKTTAGGTKIEEVKVGDGAEVKRGSSVKVLYKGSLPNGTVFDASEKHGNVPLEVVAGTGQVIPGFDDGLLGLKKGGKRKLTIPGDQAYGPNPPPGSGIPANSQLVFEIELVDVR